MLRGNFPLLALFCMLPVSAVAAPPAHISARFVPTQLPPTKPGMRETVALILGPWPTGPRRADVNLSAPAGVKVTPASRVISLKPRVQTPVFFQLEFASKRCLRSPITATVDGKEVAVLPVGQCCELEQVTWKAKYDEHNIGVAEGWMKPEFDDSGWEDRRLPSMWQDVGATYLRARVFVPDFWRGRDIRLCLKAVDDNDICYLNGVEIGRTDGWDVARDYEISPDVVRYGQDNLLCIAVDNIHAGGGIYRTPNHFGAGILEKPERPKSKLAPPGPVGTPLPFRRMVVKDGVLLYEDGGEVALWGVNYYPQSWYQYENMRRLGVDMKKAIRDDLDDMKGMGVEVIRIHVFDREISDHAGNLIDNEHLDLLDYLIFEASKRGIYFMFTPIAWWWGPTQNPDSFSARTPKEFMFCDDEAIQAQAAYLKNWLNHVNRYTTRRYKDEPAICALEIMNEPAYADYNIMTDPDACYYKTAPEVLAPFKARLVYEFDGIKTFASYFYPACARRFRNLGVQICCMFQYDSRTTAEWNTDWDAHYLNLLYTPGKAVSFSIGGKVFHDLLRGASFPTVGTTQRFGHCVVSFDRNISIYSDGSSYLQSAPYKKWKPLPVPEKPELITAVGDSPYADYEGTGIYTLKIDYPKRTAELTVNPDARVVGDPWHPNPERSAVVLHDNTHPFKLNIPGVHLKSIRNLEDSGGMRDVEVADNSFEVSRDVCVLRW